METRHLVLAGRLAALAAILTGRGSRRAAWAFHEFLRIYPAIRRNNTWHGPVATRFETAEREILLTIDDGPDPDDTPVLLDVLAARGARAMFFVVGKNVERHRDLARRAVAEGHAIANHTHTHPSALWWTLPRPAVRREIERANHAIACAAGVAPRFFRSPVGMNNSAVHPAATSCGLRVMGWSASGGDGCPAQPGRVVERIASSIQPGAILLLHEGGGRGRRGATVARLLDFLDANGYRSILPPETALR